MRDIRRNTRSIAIAPLRANINLPGYDNFSMSKQQKILTKMRNNPRDWKIKDSLTIAAYYGFEIRNDGGSHHVFSHPLLMLTICVPAHRPIKPVYIKEFVKLIDQIEEVM